jgi:hypothetical protein
MITHTHDNTDILMLMLNIVTCQPFVGWRNGVASHRPVNKVPRRRDDVTCVYVVARRRAAILSDCKGSGRRDVIVLLNNAMTVGMRPLTQFGYISEAISRFSSVSGVTVKKSVLGSSSRERVLRSSPTSEVSIGDRRCKVCDNLWKWPIAEKSASEDALSKLGDYMFYSAVKIEV